MTFLEAFANREQQVLEVKLDQNHIKSPLVSRAMYILRV